MVFYALLAISLATFSTVIGENVFCTYYRDANEITCGHITCKTHEIENATEYASDGIDMKLPLGWYRIGVQQTRRDGSWFNLYKRRQSGTGYWDFYTNIPERNCAGGFGIHSAEKLLPGSVSIKEKWCFQRLADQIERRSTIEKIDVYQCRQCVFHTCWLGWRVLPASREYLTNLRSVA